MSVVRRQPPLAAIITLTLTAAIGFALVGCLSAPYARAADGLLNIDSESNSPFTVAVAPATLTILPGKSASVVITTTVEAGFDEALQLSSVRAPAGISVSLTPTTIPAPGSGTSAMHISVAENIASGTYFLHVRASYGTTSRWASLTVHVPSGGEGATFRGCWYQQNGNRYQGVTFSVSKPGTYPFDAVLYYGTSCEPSSKADEFGFGTLLTLGTFDYTFWFTDFANRTDMSAFWYLGNNRSQCVNYEVAPDC